MTNQKGVILAVVILYTVLFTLIGYGLLAIADTDIIEVIKTIHSNQAFWIAEAGIQKGIYRLPVTEEVSFGGPLGNGNFEVVVSPIAGFTNRWNIISTANTGAATRRIHAIIGPVSNVITTTGTVSKDNQGNFGGGNSEIDGRIEEYATFSFEDIFGMTEAQIYDEATKTTNPNVNWPSPDALTGTSWITITDGKPFKITKDSWEGSGLLVVDGDLEVSGGTFDGIIWVKGSLDMGVGNPTINGSIFVEGTGEINIGGTATINYDPTAIDNVYDELDAENSTPRIVLWEEIPA